MTNIAPNKFNKYNEMQVKMNSHKRAKIKSNYSSFFRSWGVIGDNVQVPLILKKVVAFFLMVVLVFPLTSGSSTLPKPIPIEILFDSSSSFAGECTGIETVANPVSANQGPR
jgi:hypothetical protein